MICVCYTLAHGLMLINNGIFWDDWIVCTNNSQFIMDMFTASGVAQVGYFHNLLQALPYTHFIYRLIVFSCFLLSTLFLNLILKEEMIKDDTARFFVVAFFALFPVNHARIAIINAPYAVCYLAFVTASVILFRNQRSLIQRVTSLVLYAMSFSTNSLLVLHYLVVGCAIVLRRRKLSEVRSIRTLILPYADYLLLPLAYWLIKCLFLQPKGAYLGYNQLTFQGLVHAVKWTPVAIYSSFIEPALYSFESFSFTILLGSVLLATCLQKADEVVSALRPKAMFILGVVFVCAANFPYFAVYKIPQLFNDWENRHQLLVPFGASLVLYFGGCLIFDAARVTRSLQVFLFALITLIFVKTNIEFQIDYERDALKQQALMEGFRQSRVMAENSIFFFDDQALEMNVNRRAFRSYEFAGMLKTVLPGTKYSGIYSGDCSGAALYPEKTSISAKNSESRYLVAIQQGDYRLTVPNLVRLKLRQLLTPQEFRENVARVVRLSFSRM